MDADKVKTKINMIMGTSINSVIPAKAGIQVLQATDLQQNLGSRLRGNDGNFEFIEEHFNKCRHSRPGLKHTEADSLRD